MDWSAGDGMPALAGGSPITLPAGMFRAQESAIVSEVSYVYESPLQFILPSITRFQQTYYVRPRVNDRVSRR